MRFNTHKERMQHPEARLIPQSLWENSDFFYYELSDALIPIMQAEDSDVLLELQQRFFKPKSEKERKCAWVAVACSHPYLSAEVLIAISRGLKLNDEFVFRMASATGHLEVLRYLAEKTPDALGLMIQAHDYSAFQFAAQSGHLDVLRYLEKKAPGELGRMIKADDYYAFRFAAAYGQFEVLRYLEEKAPDVLGLMIQTYRYSAFRLAAKNGHLEVLRYLAEKAPDELGRMIKADDYYAFRIAAANGHQDVIDYLLSQAESFAYAEQHTREYSAHVNPFVTQKMQELHAQKNALEREIPNAIFNIENAVDAKLLFYIARNLIRRNEPGLQDDLLFLLSIPSVRALVCTAVTAGQENELLRLALRMNNQGAAELLLNIPAVRELAERNHYYREEQRGGLDLRALAQNRESSMTALSQGERERLEEALNRYQPMINTAGVEPIMNDLRNTLVSRYNNHPAEYTDSQGVTHPLPLEWNDFQQLGLQGETLKSALEAYAKHKDHSAWRYLSKPNPWMHEHASYVYVNPGNHLEKWSTFEEYQPEICLYYLGAIDEQSPPTDGYTLETRLEGFIQELALIGRAHNWDNQRYRLDADGDIQRDEEGSAIMEEYDDLEKDKPSCFSGVKRRLFQSVRGHALFTLLTADILQQEINELVRQHIKDTLSHMNEVQRDEIKTAWNTVIDGGSTAEDIATLRTLDVPIEKQNQWTAAMNIKYGRQLANDAALVNQMNSALAYKTNNDAQVLNFGHVHPEVLFEDACTQGAPRAPGRTGLFGEGVNSEIKKQKDDPAAPSPAG